MLWRRSGLGSDPPYSVYGERWHTKNSTVPSPEQVRTFWTDRRLLIIHYKLLPREFAVTDEIPEHLLGTLIPEGHANPELYQSSMSGYGDAIDSKDRLAFLRTTSPTTAAGACQPQASTTSG